MVSLGKGNSLDLKGGLGAGRNEIRWDRIRRGRMEEERQIEWGHLRGDVKT